MTFALRGDPSVEGSSGLIVSSRVTSKGEGRQLGLAQPNLHARLALRISQVVFALILVFMPRFSAAQDVADASEEAIAEARGLFEAGRGAYAQGRYAQALEYFERSYAVLQIPDVLYNIGETAAQSGHLAQAIEAFSTYLEIVPDAAEADALRERIAQLERELEATEAEEAAAATAVVAPPVVEERPLPRDDLSPLGISLLIGGGAVAVGGVPLIVVGALGNDTVESAPDGAEWARYRSDYEAGPLLTGVGITAFIIGVAAAGAGLVVLLTRGERSTAVAIGPDGAAIRVGF